MPYSKLVVAPSPATAINRIFGGDGTVSGVVDQKALPTNTPLARKVRLYEQRSGAMVGEAWSDAATGAYSFANLNRSLLFTALAYDHAGNYRAVVADNLSPT